MMTKNHNQELRKFININYVSNYTSQQVKYGQVSKFLYRV